MNENENPVPEFRSHHCRLLPGAFTVDRRRCQATLLGGWHLPTLEVIAPCSDPAQTPFDPTFRCMVGIGAEVELDREQQHKEHAHKEGTVAQPEESIAPHPRVGHEGGATRGQNGA